MRPNVAIVGSHARTRDNAPYDSPDYDIWVFNEAGGAAWTHGRIDAVFQMHTRPVYRNPANKNNADHWAWLQQPHDFPIYMRKKDRLVPASVRYPLKKVSGDLLPGFAWESGDPIQYFPSTITYSIALAIHLKYPRIDLYGIEAGSNTEYHYQRPGLTFWTGIALGRGIKVVQHCAEGIYKIPLYGYEGEIQIHQEEFLQNVAAAEGRVIAQEQSIKDALAEVNEALKSGAEDYDQKWHKFLDMSRSGTVAFGAAKEARRYHDKIKEIKNATGGVMISRQEYEYNVALARQEVSKFLGLINYEGGRAWVAWQLWKETGDEMHLSRYKYFASKQLEFSRSAGEAEGMLLANTRFIEEIDRRIQAAGGSKAVEALGG